jgi:hypothetical protein
VLQSSNHLVTPTHGCSSTISNEIYCFSGLLHSLQFYCFHGDLISTACLLSSCSAVELVFHVIGSVGSTIGLGREFVGRSG